eukprot:8285090-Alexandrium_andersonii.AAC.1
MNSGGLFGSSSASWAGSIGADAGGPDPVRSLAPLAPHAATLAGSQGTEVSLPATAAQEGPC